MAAKSIASASSVDDAENPAASSPFDDGHGPGPAVGEAAVEDVAVVGFWLEFPQDDPSPERFWDLLMEGRCVSREIPSDRINVDAFHCTGNRQENLPFRGGHFLRRDLGAFDAPFFSIIPAEVAGMDPQQRVLLETAYRALENAGIPIEKVRGSNTSVHTGCFTADYANLAAKDPEQMSRYSATGLANSMLSNRLSWFFDLRGPSVTLDSACSSSMIALDLACQGLWSGQSDMGLVAGCNLMYSVDMNIALSSMSFLSPDSKCFSFDRRANGYARGEGFGVLVIKRLPDAIRDGDTIRAVIRAIGSSQDGHTPGVTQPNMDAQASLITKTYRAAGLSMKPTRFFEAHGTGTPVGDPIEARAIGAAFANQHGDNEPLYLGAVKSNIGHLEGASGVAGVIKSILILEKGVIPPNTNFECCNPLIDSEFLNLKFPTESIPWPQGGLRRASVNSFGFGGSNSHVILDDAYNYLRLRKLSGHHSSVRDPPPERAFRKFDQSLDESSMHRSVHSLPSNGSCPPVVSRLLVWSAVDARALKRMVTAYGRHVGIPPCVGTEDSKSYLDHLTYTLGQRRTHLPWRCFATVGHPSVLMQLDARLSPPRLSSTEPKLGFVFTGQGAQWYRMGRELLVYPVFRRSLWDAQDYLSSLGCRWSLIEELSESEDRSQVDDPGFSQPICTALQVALVDLLHSFGVVPAAVVGHSSGEIAAA
ncbi:MAG: hypothetical protein Q9167_007001 [Letrouitia subvulpina]